MIPITITTVLRVSEWDEYKSFNEVCPGHAIYSRKSSLDAGGFAEAMSRANASQAVSASCHCNQNFCPPSGSDTHLLIQRAPW